MKFWDRVYIGCGCLPAVVVVVIVAILLVEYIIHENPPLAKRKQMFSVVAKGAEPLIEAINQYTTDHGRPPKSLANLNPKYERSITKPDYFSSLSVRYTEFPVIKEKIVKSDQGSANDFSALYETPWQLSIRCSVGNHDCDEFYYWPTEKYPEHIYGGQTEPVGKWFYVHG